VLLWAALLSVPRALIGVSEGGVVEEASFGLDVLTIFVADDFPFLFPAKNSFKRKQ
jgi:hypothetical protein